jgi:hypothetical protein
MDEKLTDELIEAILSPLEAAEARSLALVRALTETGTISEEKLKPFLEQAENASEIKARGLRIRLKRVLADVVRKAENDRNEEQKKQKTETGTSEADQRAEGPQQNPEEEAREHPKAESGKDEGKTAPDEESPNHKKAETPNSPQTADNKSPEEKKENAA